MATEQDTAALKERIEEALHGTDMEKASEAIASVHPTDRADLYERLERELGEAFLLFLSAMSTAQGVSPLLGHEDESAGGLMTRGYVALHPEMTVQLVRQRFAQAHERDRHLAPASEIGAMRTARSR